MTTNNVALRTPNVSSKAQPCRPENEDSDLPGWSFQFLRVQDNRKEVSPSFQERATTLQIEVVSVSEHTDIKDLFRGVGGKIGIVRFLHHNPELQVYDLENIDDDREFAGRQLRLAASKGANILLPIWLRGEWLQLAGGGYIGSFRFSVTEDIEEFMSCRWLKAARRDLLGEPNHASDRKNRS